MMIQNVNLPDDISLNLISFMKTDHDILTPAQAARLKGVSRTAIYNALTDGRLRGVRVLGRIGIERGVLRAWQPQARVGRPAGRPMTSEQKATIAEAQKRRWARLKAGEARVSKDKADKGSRH